MGSYLKIIRSGALHPPFGKGGLTQTSSKQTCSMSLWLVALDQVFTNQGLKGLIILLEVRAKICDGRWG
jgi:hypothetical protein